MSYSLWATYSALCSFYIAKFKHYFNLNPRVDHPGRPPLSDFLEFQRTRRRTGQQQIQSGAGVEQPSVPSSSEGQSEKESVGHPSPPAEADSAGLLPVLPSIPQPGLETKLALGAFKRTFARAWRPAPVPPPRGTCIISGLVELAGPKGMCVVDVRAAYHPGERRFVSIGLAVRRLQQRAQSPRGGP